MDLTEFVDQHLDENTGVPGTALAHPRTAELAASVMRIPANRVAPIVATVFWNQITADPSFRLALEAYRVPSTRARMVVVPHANSSRYDLLILDRKGPDLIAPTVVPTSVLERYVGGSQRWITGATRLRSTIDAVSQLPAALLGELLADFQESAQPTVMIARAPRFVRSALHDLVLGVEGTRRLGTVGVVATDKLDRRVLTTACHVVGRDRECGLTHRDEVRLRARASARVLDRNTVVDTATLAATWLTTDGPIVTEVCGPRDVPTPATPVVFNGARSGRVRTAVVGYDYGIAMRKALTATCVYTKPDSAGGDSGAALVDENRRVVGFCSERTAVGEILEMSVWVWARQVFDVMGLRLAGPLEP